MRHIHELSAVPVLPDAFSWRLKTRSVCACSKILKRKLVASMSRYRQLFLTGIVTLFLSGLFVSCSYLFLFQLAEHGW